MTDPHPRDQSTNELPQRKRRHLQHIVTKLNHGPPDTEALLRESRRFDANWELKGMAAILVNCGLKTKRGTGTADGASPPF